MDENPRTVLAEFQKTGGGKLRLFSVQTFENNGAYVSRTVYDVEHSRRFGYLFDQSGSGGGPTVDVRGPYFVSGPVAIEINELPTDLVSAADDPPWRSLATKRIRTRNRTRRLRSMPKEFRCDDGADLMEWLRRNAIQEDGVWCSTCSDFMPGTDLCKHVRWCDQRGWYVTPDEPCAKCINGFCVDRFEMTPHVSRVDGPLWYWSGDPELRY